MKKKIFNISSVIALFSFIVTIALLICLVFPFDVKTQALLMLLDLVAGVVFAISLSIILILGMPKDEGKGIFARGRDLG